MWGILQTGKNMLNWANNHRLLTAGVALAGTGIAMANATRSKSKGGAKKTQVTAFEALNRLILLQASISQNANLKTGGVAGYGASDASPSVRQAKMMKTVGPFIQWTENSQLTFTRALKKPLAPVVKMLKNAEASLVKSRVLIDITTFQQELYASNITGDKCKAAITSAEKYNAAFTSLFDKVVDASAETLRKRVASMRPAKYPALFEATRDLKGAGELKKVQDVIDQRDVFKTVEPKELMSDANMAVIDAAMAAIKPIADKETAADSAKSE